MADFNLIKPKESPSVIYHSLAYLRDILEEKKKDNPRASTVTPGGEVICIDNAIEIYDKCVEDYYMKEKGNINGTKRTS